MTEDLEENNGIPQDIQQVTVASHVQLLHSKAFRNCSLLVSVGLPSGLEVIGERAFASCTGLRTISVPSSVNAIRAGAFQICHGLETMDLSKARLTEIASETFTGCESLKDVRISSTVLEIGTKAFWGCFQLPFLDLPNGLLHIRSRAFLWCNSLERILIPSTVVAIGSNAFESCAALRSVEISISEDKDMDSTNDGDELEFIGSCAFRNCSKLMNIGIPKNCDVLPGAFVGWCHRSFETIGNRATTDELTKRLKARFRNLPYHKACYEQAHFEIPIVHDDGIQADQMAYDMLGLTPFHILALSSKPSVIALQKLMGYRPSKTSTNGILRFDQWNESTPLRYAIENPAPGALPFAKAMLHALLDQRITKLGLEPWKSDIRGAINSFDSSDRYERECWIHDLFALLRLHERKESTSLLEQAVWKQRIIKIDSSRNHPDDDRQAAYLNSGGGIVIHNILPYLGSIDKKLNY
ncbi:MAG: hypothetical protein SGBAC_006735 [Bacillariaceae sp.]